MACWPTWVCKPLRTAVTAASRMDPRRPSSRTTTCHHPSSIEMTGSEVAVRTRSPAAAAAAALHRGQCRVHRHTCSGCCRSTNLEGGPPSGSSFEEQEGRGSHRCCRACKGAAPKCGRRRTTQRKQSSPASSCGGLAALRRRRRHRCRGPTQPMPRCRHRHHLPRR